MKIRTSTLLFSALFAVAGAASAAGVVDVSFVEKASYSDAGTSEWEKDDNLKILEAKLQDLGQRYLRTGETLKIEVLDVDLAGTARPFPRGGEDKRIIKGTSDWPRIRLHYTFERDGKAVRSATEVVADLDYTGGLSRVRSPESLDYEKKMLEKWFKTNFAEGGPAG